jgi:hypothetical protein
MSNINTEVGIPDWTRSGAAAPAGPGPHFQSDRAHKRTTNNREVLTDTAVRWGSPWSSLVAVSPHSANFESAWDSWRAVLGRDGLVVPSG